MMNYLNNENSTKHLYYVDDDVDDLDNFKAAFEEVNPANTEIHLFKSPTKFVNSIPDTNFDNSVIILDINMPEKNGIQLLREIREADLETPILMFSTGKDSKTIENCKTLGASNYAVKPSFFTSLMRFIEYVVNFDENSMPEGGFLLQFDKSA